MVTAPSTSKLPTSSSPTLGQPKPWYRYVNLDLLVRILVNSVFHPYIIFIFYLTQAALHVHREPLAYYTLCYAALLGVLEIGANINHRLTYGKHREVKWEKEVVIITGGGSGLGRVLAEMIMRKGGKVAILDVKGADEVAEDAMERWDLVWEKCDVAKESEVKEAVDRIVDDLGAPTVLINNAASGITGLPLLSSITNPTVLSPAQAAKTLTINTVSHFNTLSALLPHLIKSPQGAHIVTISSILSHLAPASLADYTSSKSAISSLHQTLQHELRSHPDPSAFARVKTLLVETGQIKTQLFADKTSLPSYAEFFGPVLEAKDIAKEIVKTIERGDGGILRMPFYAKCMPIYSLLPGTAQALVRWFSGIDRAIGAGSKTS
ncbi:hypothetical protein LTR84_002255 [Exophiala bonariae]|uniref:NAD(P)-binding protein n=1 Tax=Exophiala bonariae TaxID=1690606 RepID=A0AAV9NAT7_9EURO|nr:hypothetical protein LTR84_002255 [Exophiala bonariae]